MAKYPFIQQHDEKDCGAACLSMISEFYGLKLPIARFRDLIKVDNQGANIYGLVTGAEKIGLNADALEGVPAELFEGISNGEISFPFIARIVNEQMFEHFVVVYEIKKDTIVIGDPGKSKIIEVPVTRFAEQWQGQIITFSKKADFEKKNGRKNGFRKFFRLLISQKKLLLFIFILSVIISAINVFGAVIFQYILSDSTEVKTVESRELQHVLSNIRTICIVIILMYILRAILQILRGYLLAITAKRVDVSLTLTYYNHLVDLPPSFHEVWKTGEFMSRFYDTSKIRDAISTAALTIMLDTIMALACGALLCYISKTLFFVTVVVMALYALIMFVFRKSLKLVNHEYMEKEAQVTSYLKETIDGIETVKANQYENAVKRKTEILYENFAHKSVKSTLIYNLQESIVSAVASIGIVILLWTGTYLCIKNVISIADLFTFYYLISYFLDPVSNLINLQPELQAAVVAGERLNDILDAEVEQDDVERRGIECLQGDLRIEHVDFRYGNREMVLQDLSMIFEQGKKTAIVGGSGCGKTTVAKLLLSFYKPERGKITIDGIDISEYRISSIRKRIAYISHDIFLFSDTIYNNLKLGNENVTEEEIKRVCKLCCADGFIDKFPLKYNTVIEENGSNLSGGQKQRIAIARALLQKPDILIMDEATGNLDTITEKSINKIIETFSDTMTWIIIAHRMNIVKNCDYIYVMSEGKVIEQGTHQTLLDINGMYKKYIISDCGK